MQPVTYTEQPGLVDAIRAAGHDIAIHDGVYVATDAAAVQAIIDAYVPPPPPVPPTLTLRQLLFALVGGGWITQDEALAAAKTGDMPPQLLTLAGQVSDAEAFAIRLTWAAMYTAERSNPLWDMLVAAGVATSEQIDDLFRAGALI